MDRSAGTLHFICGRLAAGKTTLAYQLVASEPALLICEDFWLANLSDGIHSIEDYLQWSQRCRSVMGPLIVDILRSGVSVVLDFAGNTRHDRRWVRSLFESAGAEHVLHYLNVPEDVCLARLMERNESKPEGLYFATTSEEDFRAITKYFQVPGPEEGFNLVRITN
jgi:predicted kinase